MSFFTTDQIGLLSQDTVYIDLLIEFRFKSQTIYVWNGNTEISSGGKTWQPLYGIGQVDGIGVSGQIQSEAVTFTLSGIPADNNNLLSLALEGTEETEQRIVIVYIQLFDKYWQPVGNPVGVYWGFMQPPKVNRSQATESEGATQTITMLSENAFYGRSRPPSGRYTDRDQQTRSPGDKFFQFIPKLVFKTIVWPDY